jgi:hypothetical protein
MKSAKPPEISKRDLEAFYVREKWTGAEIALLFGCPVWKVYSLLHAFGIPKRRPGGPREKSKLAERNQAVARRDERICRAIGKSGVPCRNWRLAGRPFCRYHAA